MNFKNKEKIYTRQKHEQYGQKILEKAKLTAVAFAMDQDGTVKGGGDLQYKKANVAELLQRIVGCGRYPAVITASGVSALKSFSSLNDFYSQKRIPIPTFIGIGNGAALYRFDISGRAEVYNYSLTLEEVKAIISVWEKTYQELGIRESELQPKGIKTFKGFMNTDWKGDIPEEYLDIFRQYNGRCFTEKIKVTVVFPKWTISRQRNLVKQMQTALNSALGPERYLASRGDDTFLHITHTFNVHPKLFALQKFMQELGLKEQNLVAFGDMPLDNDRGLLIDSGLPYTFTNQYFEKKDIQTPPFILPGSLKSPVGSVYKAIDYLLN